jgi:Fe2+ or Zn2+ uptake regulation protein
MTVLESILREVQNLPLRQQVKVARYLRELSGELTAEDILARLGKSPRKK